MSTSPLKTVLSACLQRLRPEVFAYHLQDDFASLWSMQPSSGSVVIIWAATPADDDLDPVQCQNNLSPIDWAVAYAATHESWPKVLVLDLQPDFNRSAPSYCHFLQMHPDLFPWLRVFQPKEILLNSIAEFLSAGAPAIGSEQREAHNSLRRGVRMTLSEGGPKAEADRHAIANIIAPLILLGDKAKPTLHSAALQRLLHATGLTAAPALPETPENQAEARDASAQTAQVEPSYGTPGPQPAESAAETGAGLHIVLLDDQAHHGWADWVNDCLPNAAPVSPVTDPSALVSDLTRQLNAASTRDLRFRLKLPETAPSKHPVLLLDLRLFSGKPAEELEFYHSLLPLIQRFKDRDDLAWPAFSSADPQLAAAIKAVSEKKLLLEFPEHHEALTWLPRILALADMSLPIILFSSTGRRDLLEPFKAFGNIVTCFEKPRLHDLVSLGDTAADIRIIAKTRLLESIRQAREWLRFRTLVARAVTDANPIVPSFSCSGTGSNVVKHFEIYFDESGSSRDDGFRIAALVAGYRDIAHAEETARIMQQKGVSWFGEYGKYCYNKTSAREASDIQRLSEKFAPELQGLFVLPLILWSNSKDNHLASDTFNADTLIQSMVGEAMELCLFLLLPRDPGITFKVYGAQRRIEVKGAGFEADRSKTNYKKAATVDLAGLAEMSVNVPAGSQKAIAEFRRRTGVPHDRIQFSVNSVEKTKLGVRVTFLSISSAQDYGSILARTFQSRPWDDARQQLGRNVTLGFAALNQPERASLAEGCRPIHIVADILPGNASWDPTGASLGAAANVLPNNGSPATILVAEGAELSRLLAIGRALDGSDYAQALANGASLDHTFQGHAQPLYQAVYFLITSSIDSLKGTHLLNAAHYLAAAPPATDGALPFARVQLRHQHWTRYPTPDPAVIDQIRVYCEDKIIVDFNAAPKQVEASVADRELKGALNNAYPGLKIEATQWMQDTAAEGLFAIVTFSPRGERPFRRVTISIPQSERLDGGQGVLFISLSIGPIPLGRLQINAGKIEWCMATPVTLNSGAPVATKGKVKSEDFNSNLQANLSRAFDRGIDVGCGHTLRKPASPRQPNQIALRSKPPKRLRNDAVCILKLPAQSDEMSISEALRNSGFPAHEVVLKKAIKGGRYAIAVIDQASLSAALAALCDGINIGATCCPVAQAFE